MDLLLIIFYFFAAHRHKRDILIALHLKNREITFWMTSRRYLSLSPGRLIIIHVGLTWFRWYPTCWNPTWVIECQFANLRCCSHCGSGRWQPPPPRTAAASLCPRRPETCAALSKTIVIFSCKLSDCFGIQQLIFCVSSQMFSCFCCWARGQEGGGNRIFRMTPPCTFSTGIWERAEQR